MKNFISLEKYNQFLSRVIEWNAVVGNRDLDLQKKITLEEIKETEEEILNGGNPEDVAKEIADVFVTAGYMNYLCTSKSSVKEFVVDDGANPKDLLESIKSEVRVSMAPSHQTIQKLIYWACKEYGEAFVHDWFEKKLESNESKFVPDEEWDEEKEIRLANVKYASKGHKNIVGVRGTFQNRPVWILRADNGKGKGLKPSTFIDC